MKEYIVINIPEYKRQLTNLNSYNDGRTKSYLDLVNSNLLSILNWEEKIMVEIDHDNQKIVDMSNSINISSNIDILTDGSNSNNEFYQQFIAALGDAQQHGIYDKIFQNISIKNS
jgi:hypothetical protein